MQTSRLLSSSSSAASPSFNSFSTTTVDLSAIAARVVQEFTDPPPQSDDDDGFEFAFHSPTQPIATADEIFSNGQIRPVNPYGGESQPRHRRPALRKLMSEERDPSSDSSSEAEEELAGVPPESYCVWSPKQSNLQRVSSSSPSRGKMKSSFSKRWKLRNILYTRSNSEGNEKLVFPAPVKKSPTKEEEERESEETKGHVFVPYRKDIIGILKNVNRAKS